MAIRTGKAYIDAIDKLKSDVWIDGQPITGKISEHPAFRGVMKSQAKLFDAQHDEALEKVMTYQSPSSGEKVGTSFLQPKTADDLVNRRKMIQQWALLSNGMMGRSPDYMNTVLTALASSTSLLEGKANCFPENIIAFYENARENDLTMTHTFIGPQVNRGFNLTEETDIPIAAKVIERNAKGIVLKGARLLATQGGITDEILVISAGGADEEAYGFGFSIPSNTPGLRFICRDSFVGSESTFNAPLSSRYEEMDCIVVFNDVLVPWDRVFFYDNLAVSNSFMTESSFVPFTLHQVVSRQIIKTEFVLGIVESMIEMLGIEIYQHVQAKASEIIVGLETMKALILKSELESKLNQWGFMEPDRTTLQIAVNVFPRLYPRFTEIIQILGASGLMMLPTENDFTSSLRNELDQYLQAATTNAEARVKTFRLAWDLAMSSFGSRETLYERFFFGDPVKLSSQLYLTYDKEPYRKRVEEFLA